MALEPNQLAAERMLLDGLEALKNGDAEKFIASFHPDAVIEFPYWSTGEVKRVQGLKDIAEIYHNLAVKMDRLEIDHIFHSGNAIIAEYRGFGRVKTTGKPFNQTYIMVWVVEDGKVMSYREYWNPLVSQEAFTADEQP
jgi:ketosteroid isomerase-like protein